MKYLLDTHVWLWMVARPDRLNARARALVADNSNSLFLSAASAWEIAIKHSLGKLALPEPPEDFVPDRMLLTGVTGLGIAHAHALRVSILPPHHRDPFDRLLVAQAQLEGMPILTADPAFGPYQVDVVMSR